MYVSLGYRLMKEDGKKIEILKKKRNSFCVETVGLYVREAKLQKETKNRRNRERKRNKT